ncbi:hypothetical protein ACFVQ4_12355 [Streptomyces laurentii]|uniref:hypothetical protein n=1 Tax=Streptomyces laurentii TaxID=39478 RepID=UPI0036BCF883
MPSGKPEERLRGVFALEHILAESPQEHASVVTVPAMYVRERTRRAPTCGVRFSTAPI